MYDRLSPPRAAGRLLDTPSGQDREGAARLALARVRKLLTAYLPGMSFDRPRLQSALAGPLAQPEHEAERLFALGWLRWLEGDPPAAEALIAEAVVRARALAPAAPAPDAVLPVEEPA